MQEHIIQSACDSKRHEFFTESLRNETRRMICGNDFFQVEKIAPEQITLTCENCGEIHIASAEMYGKDMFCLSFLCSESEERT